jgi:hypothetical protein
MKASIAFVFLAFAGLNLVAAASAPKPALAGAKGQVIAGPPPAEVVDIVIRFAATDGTPLEAKLTVPRTQKALSQLCITSMALGRETTTTPLPNTGMPMVTSESTGTMTIIPMSWRGAALRFFE